MSYSGVTHCHYFGANLPQQIPYTPQTNFSCCLLYYNPLMLEFSLCNVNLISLFLIFKCSIVPCAHLPCFVAPSKPVLSEFQSQQILHGL